MAPAGGGATGGVLRPLEMLLSHPVPREEEVTSLDLDVLMEGAAWGGKPVSGLGAPEWAGLDH